MQELQLKVLTRKLDMINAETTLMRAESQRTTDSTALVKMVEDILHESEYKQAETQPLLDVSTEQPA